MSMGSTDGVVTEVMNSPYFFGGFVFVLLAVLLVVTTMINVDR